MELLIYVLEYWAKALLQYPYAVHLLHRWFRFNVPVLQYYITVVLVVPRELYTEHGSD